MVVDAKMLAELDAATTDMELTVARFIGMFCGDPGTGKSVFAMHLAQVITPPDKKIVHIDTSDGWVSFLNHPSLMNRAQHVAFDSLKGIEIIAEAIRQGYGRYANVGTVIVDELSSLAGDNLQRVATRREDKLSAEQKKSNLDEGGLDRKDYNLSGNLVFERSKY